MPFETPAGPAVLVANICTAPECARRLGVHSRSIYNWAAQRERTKFPDPLPCNPCHYDYAEVYEWFRQWALAHPGFYPRAVMAILREPIPG